MTEEMTLLSANDEEIALVNEVGTEEPVPENESEYEGVIGLDVWTMIFTFCNLLLLFYFARKFLFKPVKKMIDSRQKEIDDLYDDAGKAKTEAEEFRAEYEVKLENATAESEEIMRRAVRNAQLKEEEILKQARDEAAKTLQRAEEQIDKERKQAMEDIKNDVSDVAIDIAKAVLDREITAKEHHALIDGFIEKLGE
ncbi:MAG: F0F1 ATP synthase subunit B [Ruminococcaceae bacterium]|nr:F0F1 ATP synthase subunit B [Oscillospiraceae bacterium]